MRILLVIDQFDHDNNGTTISARRFAEILRQHGNEVRVVSTGEGGPEKYTVRAYKVPFFDGLIQSQGMTLAKPDTATLEEAVRWAEVVHFLMPFPLSIKGEEIASKLGVPHTAAFHVQPENITYSIGMGKWDWVNDGIYKGFNRAFYNKFRHIHCPSRFIANELEKHGYTAKLHVISNGIESDFTYRKLEKQDRFRNHFVLLMIGRLSNEKRQDVLIHAIQRSRHAGEIQLVLAGQGPKHDSIVELGKELANPPIIGFFPKEQLKDIIAMSDLYVHSADVEIEAISCIEAFASGLVPIIANSPKSATPQFALDERSLFRAGDAADLAEKIDYWIEHPDLRREMEYRYAEHGKQYNIDSCVSQIEEMYRQEIEENRLCRP